MFDATNSRRFSRTPVSVPVVFSGAEKCEWGQGRPPHYLIGSSWDRDAGMASGKSMTTDPKLRRRALTSNETFVGAPRLANEIPGSKPNQICWEGGVVDRDSQRIIRSSLFMFMPFAASNAWAGPANRQVQSPPRGWGDCGPSRYSCMTGALPISRPRSSRTTVKAKRLPSPSKRYSNRI
jgi:hypothetical protein